MSQRIRIVFDGPPGPEAGRFIEVEDLNGASLSVGEWVPYESPIQDANWWALELDWGQPANLVYELTIDGNKKSSGLYSSEAQALQAGFKLAQDDYGRKYIGQWIRVQVLENLHPEWKLAIGTNSDTMAVYRVTERTIGRGGEAGPLVGPPPSLP